MPARSLDYAICFTVLLRSIPGVSLLNPIETGPAAPFLAELVANNKMVISLPFWKRYGFWRNSWKYSRCHRSLEKYLGNLVEESSRSWRFQWISIGGNTGHRVFETIWSYSYKYLLWPPSSTNWLMSVLMEQRSFKPRCYCRWFIWAHVANWSRNAAANSILPVLTTELAIDRIIPERIQHSRW